MLNSWMQPAQKRQTNIYCKEIKNSHEYKHKHINNSAWINLDFIVKYNWPTFIISKKYKKYFNG